MKKIRYFVNENSFLSSNCKELEGKSEKDAAILRDYINKLAEQYGWGNGYVVIPPEHPLYGDKFDRNLLNFEEPITLADYGRNLHTFDIPEEEYDCFIVGFDTACVNRGREYTKERVESLAKSLAKEIQKRW